MTWVDWLALLVVVGFAIRGVLQGALRQVFAFVGWVAGLWAALRIAQWVGLHWQGARPAAAFGALHWMIAALVGLAVAALFNLWGVILGTAAAKSPLGGFDRFAGLAAGGAWGIVCVTFGLWLALSTHQPRPLGEAAARARCAAPLMTLAVQASAAAREWLDPVPWVDPSLRAALRRAQSRH